MALATRSGLQQGSNCTSPKDRCAPRCYQPAAALDHGRGASRGGWVSLLPARGHPMALRAAHCPLKNRCARSDGLRHLKWPAVGSLRAMGVTQAVTLPRGYQPTPSRDAHRRDHPSITRRRSPNRCPQAISSHAPAQTNPAPENRQSLKPTKMARSG